MVEHGALYRTLHSLYAWLFVPSHRAERRRMARSLALYARFIRPGDLCFDVGANTGDRTEQFLRLGARVVAFEPQPDCVRVLSARYGGNPRVTLVERAVGANDGTAELFLGRFNNVSSLSPEWIAGAKRIPELSSAEWERSVRVAVTTLDWAIAEFGVPAFCKIDVEGFERDVLQGLSRPVPSLSFEYTPWRIDPAIECVERLSTLGPYEFNYSPEETMTLALPRFVDAGRMTDILARQLASPAFSYGDVYATLT